MVHSKSEPAQELLDLKVARFQELLQELQGLIGQGVAGPLKESGAASAFFFQQTQIGFRVNQLAHGVIWVDSECLADVCAPNRQFQLELNKKCFVVQGPVTGALVTGRCMNEIP